VTAILAPVEHPGLEDRRRVRSVPLQAEMSRKLIIRRTAATFASDAGALGWTRFTARMRRP
jgi:hypothetical protein